jgi:hypothetical protein
MKNYLIILLFTALTSVAYAQPKLSSYATVTPTIFLDFDGHLVRSTGWNNGSTFSCAPSTMTSAQITDIFNRVSEDFRPFNVNITTDSTVFLAAPLNRRMRVIITPTSAWTNGVGGLAYISSFTWGDDTPCFVFQDRLQGNPKYIAECCSHEAGHTLGLSHQSAYDANCHLVSTYSEGTGTGEIGWAPIMGNSYYKNMTGWNAGPTPYGCTNVQDNLTIITSQNGFTYRGDDFTQTKDVTTTTLNSGTFNIKGIISTNADKDAFRLVVNNTTTVHLQVIPFSINNSNMGANLDVKVELYNSANVLLNTYNRPAFMDAVVDTMLNSGTYYFVVYGTGNTNISNYGSLGSYTLSGFSSAALPIREVALTGNTDRNNHLFNWNIISDEPIKNQELQVSVDGISYRPLTHVNTYIKSYSYLPVQSGMLYYRLKVTSVIEDVAYSNVIALRSKGKESLLSVSTFVHNDITVNSGSNYQYQLLDMNGRILAKGVQSAGMSKINMSNLQSGIYILHTLSNNQRQTERIIKQ